MKKIAYILVLVMLMSFVCAIASACGEKYDLVYASWNLSTAEINNIERRMIAAFEEKYDVKVKIEENIAQGAAYDSSLTGLAAQKKFPDVFMMSNLNFGLSNKYVINLSEYASNDADWAKIPGGIEEAVHYGNGIYAIPFAMHMMGYFVNTDLLEQYNIDELTVNPTYEQFEDVVAAFSSKVNEGVIGLSHEGTIFEWYSASVDDDLGWYSWDGEKYNLDSDAFKEGMAKTKQMRENAYTYDSLSEEVRAQYFEGIEGYVQLWDLGKLAIRWAETYAVPDMLSKAEDAFNIKFIGVPGGRTPVVGDYLGISPTCKNPELAYKFAKWMSFDPEGIQMRMQLDTECNENNTFPLTTDETIIKAYFQKYDTIDGFEEVYSTLANGIVEGVKVVPGYTLSRWNALTGITVGEIANCSIGALLDMCWNGDLTYADYAHDLNVLANQRYANAVKEYKDLYD